MARRSEPEVKLKTNLAATARIGVMASLALLVIGFVWMQSTMISGAVIASGQAVVAGKPKKVQSLDGGVVSEIFVEDGDVVRAGDVLIKLDPTLLLINQDIYRNRLAEVTARESRLAGGISGRGKRSRLCRRLHSWTELRLSAIIWASKPCFRPGARFWTAKKNSWMSVFCSLATRRMG